MTLQELEQEFILACKEMEENQATFMKIDPNNIDLKTKLEMAAVFENHKKATIMLNNMIKKIILQDAIRKELTGNE